jgi:hypothetical protein
LGYVLWLAGPAELCQPEQIPNPVLHHFFACLAKRMVEGNDAQVGELLAGHTSWGKGRGSLPLQIAYASHALSTHPTCEV